MSPPHFHRSGGSSSLLSTLAALVFIIVRQISMPVRSAYTVYSAVFDLCSRPFNFEGDLRDPYRSIFDTRNCFSSVINIDNLYSPKEYYLRGEFENKFYVDDLFIKNLGRVSFNTRRFHQFPDYDADDERRSFRFFELDNPLFLKGYMNDTLICDGKAFLHIYPSGYAILHIAIDIKLGGGDSIGYLSHMLNLSNPRSKPGIYWESRIGQGNISDIVNKIRKSIRDSIFKDRGVYLGKRWYGSHTKILSNIEKEKITNEIYKDDTSEIHVGEKNGYDEFIISKGDSFIINFFRDKKRDSVLRFFWNSMMMFEFVILKNRVFRDYRNFLEEEITNLKSYRLDTLNEMSRFDVMRMSVYDPQIPRYIDTLDRAIRFSSSHYQRIYSHFSDVIGFDSLRRNVISSLKEWEQEAEKWNNPIRILWDKIINPFRLIISNT